MYPFSYLEQELSQELKPGSQENPEIFPNQSVGPQTVLYVLFCMLSPCLFNLHAEYIMWNARLEEAQAGIKIAGRNISNLRYADDTIRMAESEEELKSLLMKVKEEREEADLKFNIQKTKIMAPGPITSWQIDGEKWKPTDFIFLNSKS